MKALSLLTFLLLTSTTSALAKSTFTAGPIVGYERVQKISPTPHTKSRLVYGLKALYGIPILSAEAELTQGKDTESFPEQDLTIDESVINAKLGIRSHIIRSKFITTYLRAGGHARKSEIERTEAGVTTTSEPAIRISPYAGAGLSINIFNKVRANLGLTAIFTGHPRGSDREYQTTLGFSIKI